MTTGPTLLIAPRFGMATLALPTATPDLLLSTNPEACPDKDNYQPPQKTIPRLPRHRTRPSPLLRARQGVLPVAIPQQDVPLLVVSPSQHTQPEISLTQSASQTNSAPTKYLSAQTETKPASIPAKKTTNIRASQNDFHIKQEFSEIIEATHINLSNRYDEATLAFDLLFDTEDNEFEVELNSTEFHFEQIRTQEHAYKFLNSLFAEIDINKIIGKKVVCVTFKGNVTGKFSDCSITFILGHYGTKDRLSLLGLKTSGQNKTTDPHSPWSAEFNRNELRITYDTDLDETQAFCVEKNDSGVTLVMAQPPQGQNPQPYIYREKTISQLQHDDNPIDWVDLEDPVAQAFEYDPDELGFCLTDAHNGFTIFPDPLQRDNHFVLQTPDNELVSFVVEYDDALSLFETAQPPSFVQLDNGQIVAFATTPDGLVDFSQSRIITDPLLSELASARQRTDYHVSSDPLGRKTHHIITLPSGVSLELIQDQNTFDKTNYIATLTRHSDSNWHTKTKTNAPLIISESEAGELQVVNGGSRPFLEKDNTLIRISHDTVIIRFTNGQADFQPPLVLNKVNNKILVLEITLAEFFQFLPKTESDTPVPPPSPVQATNTDADFEITAQFVDGKLHLPFPDQSFSVVFDCFPEFERLENGTIIEQEIIPLHKLSNKHDSDAVYFEQPHSYYCNGFLFTIAFWEKNNNTLIAHIQRKRYQLGNVSAAQELKEPATQKATRPLISPPTTTHNTNFLGQFIPSAKICTASETVIRNNWAKILLATDCFDYIVQQGGVSIKFAYEKNKIKNKTTGQLRTGPVEITAKGDTLTAQLSRVDKEKEKYHLTLTDPETREEVVLPVLFLMGQVFIITSLPKGTTTLPRSLEAQIVQRAKKQHLSFVDFFSQTPNINRLLRTGKLEQKPITLSENPMYMAGKKFWQDIVYPDGTRIGMQISRNQFGLWQIFQTRVVDPDRTEHVIDPAKEIVQLYKHGTLCVPLTINNTGLLLAFRNGIITLLPLLPNTDYRSQQFSEEMSGILMAIEERRPHNLVAKAPVSETRQHVTADNISFPEKDIQSSRVGESEVITMKSAAATAHVISFDLKEFLMSANTAWSPQHNSICFIPGPCQIRLPRDTFQANILATNQANVYRLEVSEEKKWVLYCAHHSVFLVPVHYSEDRMVPNPILETLDFLAHCKPVAAQSNEDILAHSYELEAQTVPISLPVGLTSHAGLETARNAYIKARISGTEQSLPVTIGEFTFEFHVGYDSQTKKFYLKNEKIKATGAIEGEYSLNLIKSAQGQELYFLTINNIFYPVYFTAANVFISTTPHNPDLAFSPELIIKWHKDSLEQGFKNALVLTEAEQDKDNNIFVVSQPMSVQNPAAQTMPFWQETTLSNGTVFGLYMKPATIADQPGTVWVPTQIRYKGPQDNNYISQTLPAISHYQKEIMIVFGDLVDPALGLVFCVLDGKFCIVPKGLSPGHTDIKQMSQAGFELLRAAKLL